MDKNVMLVWGKEAAFFSTTIQEKLEEKGVAVKKAKPIVNEVNACLDFASMIVYYITEDSTEHDDFLIFLRDCCIGKEKMLCVIGDDAGVERIQKVAKGNVISLIFKRPIDVKAVVEGICASLSAENAKDQLKHILVVDDAPLMLRTVKSWFETKYKVSIANSATMAISFLAKQKPDLILLDYEMPHCSGPQFLEMIQAEDSTKDIPVIFLTGKNDQESVKNAIGLKPQGYLLKTMNSDEIVKYVDEFMTKMEEIRKQSKL